MEEPEEEPPPWESALIKTDVPDKRDQVRDRETAGMKHLRRVKKLQKKENTQVIYTDATVTKEGKAACAWFNTTKNNYGRRLLEEGTHVKRAELEAVADAIQSHCHEEKKTIYLFSDSREAIEELRNPCTMDKAAQKIMINIKEARSKDTNFYLEWVPGHSGILGQDRAEREAKAEIIFQYYRHQSTLPAIVPVKQRDPFDFAPHEARDVNKERRRARLNALKPIPPALPTMRLNQWFSTIDVSRTPFESSELMEDPVRGLDPCRMAYAPATAAASALVLLCAIDSDDSDDQLPPRKKPRSKWTSEWLARVHQQGAYENFMRELALEDSEAYRRWIRGVVN
ncbi:hypothetical protein HPB47_023168 [Ixodes persulcatus]|uniref:Uncharacterized protein n=1 Tax=Ixodes persulcatus TaxID=34615 RepID=A0AC60QAY1_IXOPE|nr:hypothetical protein HPB47_023168 [Ixodes persulcatus]